MYNSDNSEIRAYENLANAIILKAVDDYEHALAVLCTEYSPEEEEEENYTYEAKKMKGSCDVFFRSKWYRTLTTIDSSVITESTKRLILNAPWMKYNERKKRYECECGYTISKNQINNKRIPVYKCSKCGRFTRTYGEAKKNFEFD